MNKEKRIPLVASLIGSEELIGYIYIADTPLGSFYADHLNRHPEILTLGIRATIDKKTLKHTLQDVYIQPDGRKMKKQLDKLEKKGLV